MNRAPPGPQPALFGGAATAMLHEGGFNVYSESRGWATLFHGTRGGCTLFLSEDDPHGTFDQRYRELAAPVGPLRFAWRGRVYESVPKAAALVDFYMWRELRRIAVAAPRAPLVVWAATPGCDTSRVDWSRLAGLPG